MFDASREASVTCAKCQQVILVSQLHIGCKCGPRLAVSPARKPQRPAQEHGPGTELKKLLKRVGITATPNCSCNARAAKMDQEGAEWCEAHLDEIVGWLREEATKRGLPFLDAAGRVLVRRAISNARKEAARATQAANAQGSEA
jgi:hypothetical protein